MDWILVSSDFQGFMGSQKLDWWKPSAITEGFGKPPSNKERGRAEKKPTGFLKNLHPKKAATVGFWIFIVEFHSGLKVLEEWT